MVIEGALAPGVPLGTSSMVSVAVPVLVTFRVQAWLAYTKTSE
jgi:hypothetical protein